MWPERTTIPGDDGRPKIHRHYLVGTGKTFGIFLHRFVGNDAPTEFHDHPGRFNLLLPGQFHRVELRRERPAWTLFVHGPKIRKWGFLDSTTGAFRFWTP